MFYHLIALLVFTYSVVRGYRKGVFRQVPMLIGFGLGVICAHLFAAPVEECLRDMFPSVATKPQGEFVYSIFSRGLIYLLVYELFSFITGFLKIFFAPLPKGMLGSLGGAAFMAVRYMLTLSVLYNFLLCWNMDSSLMRYAKSDDGNIVEEVMLIAPAILGGEDVGDLAHRLQLEAAKCIS